MKRLFILAALLFTSVIFANPVHNIVVFGDSLSDNGNLWKSRDKEFPSSKYYLGRFSNGPVWVEYLVQDLFTKNPSQHMSNYAFGGALVTSEIKDPASLSLDGQVKKYFEDHQQGDIQDSLFIVWIGSNNYVAVPKDRDHKLVREVNAGIAKNLDYIAQKGAKNILVLNLPDLGKTPSARQLDTYCGSKEKKTCASDPLSEFSNEHNRVLMQRLDVLRAEHADVNWLYFDLNRMFSDVIADPTRYNLTNAESTCRDLDQMEGTSTSPTLLERIADAKTGGSVDKCDGYLFFDLLHPTTFAHEVIAREVQTMLKDSGLEVSDEGIS